MSKELNILISSLSEDKFKKLIQEYCKERYKTPHVRVIDGPWDGGNDLEIIIGEVEIRKNIQITVQKVGFEDKLKKDLIKSAQNVSKYNYQNSLDFYISQNLSKEKRNELVLEAEVMHKINLKIIDGNILAQEAEIFETIRNFTYDAHEIKSNLKSTIADKQTKILFDVLTLDKNSIEIKRNFINSYIFSFLFATPNSTIDEIINYINPHLNNSLHKDFLEKELNYLRSKHIIISPTDKRRYELSVDKKSEIDLIYSNVIAKEDELKIIIENFIIKYNIDSTSKEVVEILYKLYRENYTIDIDEIQSTNSSFSASIRKLFNDLISFFNKKGIEQEKAKELAKELLKICDNNDFLNKLSSIHLFNNLYSSDKLEKYVNQKVQTLVLDTQILIRMLCVLYNDKIDYSDSALQSVKILLSTFEKFKSRIKLSTTFDYVGEVAGHMLEAIKLQRFLSLPFAAKLGKSKNVFYNAFVELQRNDQIEEDIDFAGFIETILNEDLGDLTDQDFLTITSKKIEDILTLSNIELIFHPNYPNYQDIKKAYEISLAYQSKDRSFTARENDLRTIMYLATKENHTNISTNESNEPFLITWDSAFYAFRKKLLNDHKELSYWYIYSPLKVVDRFSVMNFNLNPSSISLNIIALTETNFNYSTKTISFIDVISSFFNEKDMSKLNIINKLSELKNMSQNIDELPNSEELKVQEEDTLTHLLLNLRSHYYSSETKYRFDDIIKVFELPKFENEILEIFSKTINSYKINTDLKIMFQGFDNLIELNK